MQIFWDAPFAHFCTYTLPATHTTQRAATYTTTPATTLLHTFHRTRTCYYRLPAGGCRVGRGRHSTPLTTTPATYLVSHLTAPPTHRAAHTHWPRCMPPSAHARTCAHRYAGGTAATVWNRFAHRSWAGVPGCIYGNVWGEHVGELLHGGQERWGGGEGPYHLLGGALPRGAHLAPAATAATTHCCRPWVTPATATHSHLTWVAGLLPLLHLPLPPPPPHLLPCFTCVTLLHAAYTPHLPGHGGWRGATIRPPGRAGGRPHTPAPAAGWGGVAGSLPGWWWQALQFHPHDASTSRTAHTTP